MPGRPPMLGRSRRVRLIRDEIDRRARRGRLPGATARPAVSTASTDVHPEAGSWCVRRSFAPGLTVEQVLVHTRLAADAAGATRMDRPRTSSPIRCDG
jgi:hypothetical protein